MLELIQNNTQKKILVGIDEISKFINSLLIILEFGGKENMNNKNDFDILFSQNMSKYKDIKKEIKEFILTTISNIGLENAIKYEIIMTRNGEISFEYMEEDKINNNGNKNINNKFELQFLFYSINCIVSYYIKSQTIDNILNLVFNENPEKYKFYELEMKNISTIENVSQTLHPFLLKKITDVIEFHIYEDNKFTYKINDDKMLYDNSNYNEKELVDVDSEEDITKNTVLFRSNYDNDYKNCNDNIIELCVIENDNGDPCISETIKINKFDYDERIVTIKNLSIIYYIDKTIYTLSPKKYIEKLIEEHSYSYFS